MQRCQRIALTGIIAAKSHPADVARMTPECAKVVGLAALPHGEQPGGGNDGGFLVGHICGSRFRGQAIVQIFLHCGIAQIEHDRDLF